MMKLAIYAGLSGLVLIFGTRPARTGQMQAIRFLLIGIVVTIPLILDHRLRTVVQGILVLSFMALEWLFQRNPYVFSSDEHFLSATNTALLRGIYLALGYFWLDRLNGIAVPWGFEAHHAPVWLQAITIFIVVDLVRYMNHRFQHKFDWWWQFHKIHHSALEVSALTSSRGHLFDTTVSILIIPTLIAYLLGVRADVFLFASQIPAVILANAYAHANIDFPKAKAWWAYLLTSPNAHAHHHTRQHGQTNFGNVTLIWDWLFGTIDIPKEAPSDFGIDEPEIATMGVLEQTLHPFGLTRPYSIRTGGPLSGTASQ
jgi:sterol desaturase/sphingolipid hydroxylase (fatty acid hydroxylase superfamily)